MHSHTLPSSGVHFPRKCQLAKIKLFWKACWLLAAALRYEEDPDWTWQASSTSRALLPWKWVWFTGNLQPVPPPACWGLPGAWKHEFPSLFLFSKLDSQGIPSCGCCVVSQMVTLKWQRRVAFPSMENFWRELEEEQHVPVQLSSRFKIKWINK